MDGYGDSAWKTVSLLYLTLSDKHPSENRYKEAMSEQRERAGVDKLWDSCVFALVCLKTFLFFHQWYWGDDMGGDIGALQRQ